MLNYIVPDVPSDIAFCIVFSQSDASIWQLVVSTMTDRLCPSHMLGGLWQFYQFFRVQHAPRQTRIGFDTGVWSFTIAPWITS